MIFRGKYNLGLSILIFTLCSSSYAREWRASVIPPNLYPDWRYEELLLLRGTKGGASLLFGPFFNFDLKKSEEEKGIPISQTHTFIESITSGRFLLTQVRDSVGVKVFRVVPSIGLVAKNYALCWTGHLEMGDSTPYPPKKWKGTLRADYTRGVLYFSSNKLRVSLGRDYLFWGEGLLFSESAIPVDRLSISLNLSKINLHYSAGLKEEPPGKNLEAPVFFSSHFVEGKLGRMYLGMAETITFGGQWNLIDPALFVPTGLYYVRQWVRHRGDYNILWSIAAKILAKSYIYGFEFLIDDFPYKVSEHGEHPKIAFATSICKRSSLLGFPSYLHLLMRGATRWTYGHRQPNLSWLNWGLPLAQPEGSDYLTISMLEKLEVDQKSEIALVIFYTLKGEGVIGEPEPDVFPKSYFLTGTVEKILNLHFAIAKFWRFGLFEIRVGSTFIFDEDHVSGRKKFNPFLSLRSLLFLHP